VQVAVHVVGAGTFLRDRNAREWQIALTAEVLTEAIATEAPPTEPLD
jgi:ribonuclease D